MIRLSGRAIGLVSLLLSLASGVAASAALRIANETAVSAPTSAHYSTAVNFRPGDGEIVNHNPPIFSWFYNTNHLVGGEQNPNGFFPHWATQTNSFRLQISTQPSMAGPLAVDVTTPFNFYNFLAPLDTSATRRFWWRVQYVTNGIPYFTSATRSFVISVTASNWDRSMLADPNYYATNAVHPMFCYRAGEEAAIWAYAQTNNLAEFNNLLTYANGATNQAWFKQTAEWPVNSARDPKRTAPTVDGMTRSTQIGAVLFLHRFSGDNRWTNASMSGWLVTNLSHAVNWFVSPSNNYPMLDYGDSESPEGLRLCVATYDWLYDYLGSNTATFNGRLRTNALHAMRLTARFMTAMDFWFPNRYPLGQFVYFYDWNYRARTNYCVQGPSIAKQDSAHLALDRTTTMMLGLIGGEDDPELRFHRELMLNFFIARQAGVAGWAAHHAGAYGYVDGQVTLQSRNLYSALMLIDVAYPQAQIQRTDFCTRFPEWYSRMLPYGKRMYHGAYGDGMPAGWAGHFFGIKNRGWDLAALTGNGFARRLYDLNQEYHGVLEGFSSRWDLIPTRYHFPLPAPATNTNAKLYPEDGFVVASSKSPSEVDCYTNGVGFSLKAPPRGNYSNHQVPDALSFDLWAYGTQLTDGGGGSLDPYCYQSEASPGLFINGYGMSGTVLGGRALIGYSQTVPVESSIVHYTNGGTFVYACADGTALFTNAYHPLKSLVTKVRRHVLFPRSKYWVVYDEFETRAPATFAFRWHIPWAFRYDPSGTVLTRETTFSNPSRPFLIGSNSLVMTIDGFKYVAGNFADATYPNPPRVPVHVQFANAVGSYGVFNAVGTGGLGASGTGVIGTSGTNSTLNPFLNRTFATVNPDRAVGMWVTNKVATTNWHLMTVIVPQQPGVDAPTIVRLDDNTVIVTYDGVTETNSFGTSYSGAATYRVDVPGIGGRVTVPPRIVQGVKVQQ